MAMRVIAVTLRYNDTQLCVINVYMPPGNNKSTKAKYLDTLAAIRVVILKYRGSHLVLLVEDFNIDSFKESYERDIRRVKLLEMTAELGLKLISDGTDPMMFAHNGKHTSHLELLFRIETPHIKYVDVKVGEMVPRNTLCHVPVSTSLECDLRQTVATPKKTPSKNIKLIRKWHTLNRAMYSRCISRYLQLMDL